MFIIEPIVKLAKACIEMDQPLIEKLMQTIEVKLLSEEKHLQGKALFRAIMQKWIDAADALLEMIVTHLPSPKRA